MNLLQKASLAIRFVGLRATLRTIRYAMIRDWLDRGRKSKRNAAPVEPGEILGFDPSPTGGNFTFTGPALSGGLSLSKPRAEGGLALEVLFLSPEIVRLTWTPGSLPIPFSLNEAAIQGRLSQSPASSFLAMRNSEGQYIFETPALTLALARNGELKLETSAGVLHTARPPTLTGASWAQTCDLRPEERIYGLGERAAPLNLRGGAYRFWNTDPGGSYGPGADPLYMGIPVYMGLHDGGSYLVFHENSWEGAFETSEVSRTSEVWFAGGALRTYLIVGTPAELLERFTALTGRPELPPRWALGFHHCRYGYASEAEVRTTIAGFEQHKLPLDVFHQDIDYMDGYRVFTVDKSRYPNFPSLTNELHGRGIKLVTIIDPGVKTDPQWDMYRDGRTANAFVGQTGFPRVPTSTGYKELMGTQRKSSPTRGLVWPGWSAFPDFTSPAARQWWGQYYTRLLDQGVDGFWHDMNEPAAFTAWGDPTLPHNAAHDMEGRGGMHAEAHNLYGLLMDRAGHEALRQHRPQRRPWLLTRSGWAGVQRYAWHWTGDTESTWEALRMTIPQVLNVGVSGVPYCGPDIGGFSGNPNAELYTRWFQMAALLPFFRNHAAKTSRPREPWVYGEPYTSIIRNSLHLRHRLMPYLYTLAWEASRTGAPLARPLFWMEPGNPDLWDVDDAFLLGNALLVAPILEPKAKLRKLHLPSGRWHYFWSDYCLEDTMQFETPVSLQRIPIYVRGGTVLPTEEGNQLILEVYPDGSGLAAGEVYSDAGDGYGLWRVDSFRVEPHPSEVLVFHSHAGDYPFPWEGIQVKVHSLDLPTRLITS